MYYPINQMRGPPLGTTSLGQTVDAFNQDFAHEHLWEHIFFRILLNAIYLCIQIQNVHQKINKNRWTKGNQSALCWQAGTEKRWPFYVFLWSIPLWAFFDQFYLWEVDNTHQSNTQSNIFVWYGFRLVSNQNCFIPCSPDSATNSEITNLIFDEYFGQVSLVLRITLVFSSKIIRIF